jgi:hypothetical protein
MNLHCDLIWDLFTEQAYMEISEYLHLSDAICFVWFGWYHFHFCFKK